MSALWDFFSYGLKNKFKIAVICEPSVFKLLKFYCIKQFTVFELRNGSLYIISFEFQTDNCQVQLCTEFDSNLYLNTCIFQSASGSQNEPSGWPVVMVTGFTVPYLSMVQVRQQVRCHIPSCLCRTSRSTDICKMVRLRSDATYDRSRHYFFCITTKICAPKCPLNNKWTGQLQR